MNLLHGLKEALNSIAANRMRLLDYFRDHHWRGRRDCITCYRAELKPPTGILIPDA